ncbi:low molecular weight phosphotyrosine protein phosphatase [Campylobacter sp. RM9334]|uniref:low molecular weight protein-tyrosine-phosphatase n=1 Tax=Campylobacter sp. RM9334 TaxID=2735732 RepID=UPI001D644710|nr:low molecular weight phosphotyrosine protein phosphatase [Campylobacter sp. RM9334]
MKIMFVCLGNICRSPMAEFIMKNLCKNKEFKITSSGTAGYHDGEDMHIGTKKLLKNKNIECDNFVSKKLTKKLCQEYDLILTMDESNYKDVLNNFSEFKDKVKPICSYCDLGYKNVPDPWYTNNFDEVYMILNNACKNILKEIENNKI